MPCPFVGPKNFCAGPILWARPKFELNFSAPPKRNSPYENNFLSWHKKFGTDAICKSVFGMAQEIWGQPENFWDP